MDSFLNGAGMGERWEESEPAVAPIPDEFQAFEAWFDDWRLRDAPPEVLEDPERRQRWGQSARRYSEEGWQARAALSGCGSTAGAAARIESAEPVPAVQLPGFIRREVERAIDEAVNPRGMSVHDGKARIGADRLSHMLMVIDALTNLQKAAPAEPVAWLRDQRGEYEGRETLDPMWLLGPLVPSRGRNGATYSPLYAHPPAEPATPLGPSPEELVELSRATQAEAIVLADGWVWDKERWEWRRAAEPAAGQQALLSLIGDYFDLGVEEGRETEDGPVARKWGEIRAALRSLSAAGQQAPEGWQLVPVEPTPEMCKAALDDWYGSSDSTWQSLYAAMLSAAPKTKE